MFFSLGLILLSGLTLGWVCSKLKLPPLTGMIAAGILIGPSCFNLLSAQVLDLSADIRKIALLIIISRAGLSLSLKDLKRGGTPSVLMTFVPATFEIAGTILLAPWLLGLSWTEAALLGAVIAAVSPAVVVPRMLKLMKEGYGYKHAIPQMILAGSSMDDIYVIVLFSAFLTMVQTGSFEFSSLIQIPVSIGLGIAAGMGLGWLMAWFYKKVSIRPIIQVVQFYAAAFLLTALESALDGIVPFSSLLAVMSSAMVLAKKIPEAAGNISRMSNSMWSVAEIFLFVLVGAEVSIQYALNTGLDGVLLLALVMLFRMAGVWCCVRLSKMDRKSRLFCMIAYTPKATVQAAIGSIPLAMGLACGNTILTVAVLAILLTAPIGAWAIDLTYRKLLPLDGPGAEAQKQTSEVIA